MRRAPFQLFPGLALWALLPALSVAAGPSGQVKAGPEDPRTVRTIAAVPAPGPVTIDGVLSEAVWQTPGAGGFTQSDPSDGEPASEPTTVWVAFDHDNLYVAARLADSEPARSVGRLGRSDEEVEADWI